MTARFFFSVGQPGNLTIDGVEDSVRQEKRAVIDRAYNLSHRRSPVRWPLETVLHCDRAMRIPAVLTQEIHRLSTDEIKICRNAPVLSDGMRVADF